MTQQMLLTVFGGGKLHVCLLSQAEGSVCSTYCACVNFICITRNSYSCTSIIYTCVIATHWLKSLVLCRVTKFVDILVVFLGNFLVIILCRAKGNFITLPFNYLFILCLFICLFILLGEKSDSLTNKSQQIIWCVYVYIL